MSPEEYLESVMADLAPKALESEELGLGELLGRTLAADVTARFAVPPFTNSGMDGFAVRSADFTGEGPWVVRVHEDIPAGAAPEAELADGDTAVLPAARIMTGAMVPEWADAVVKVEDTDAPPHVAEAPARVTVFAAPKTGLNVRRAGEDTPEGGKVFAAGAVLYARSLSSLASVGRATVAVTRRPRVAVLATGAELYAPGEDLAPGKIPDSNSTLLAGLVAEAGAVTTLVEAVDDTAEAFAAAVARAAAVSDLIVTSGGVSMGAFDVVKEHGMANGWTFTKVTMQPGKPQGHGLATPDGPGVICLPGNPVSVAVSFRLFVRPVIDALLGRIPDNRVFTAHAGVSWKSSPGRRQFLPAVLTEDGRVLPVHALRSASHLVASLHAAEVLAIIPEDQVEVTEGEQVSYIWL